MEKAPKEREPDISVRRRRLGIATLYRGLSLVIAPLGIFAALFTFVLIPMTLDSSVWVALSVSIAIGVVCIAISKSLDIRGKRAFAKDAVTETENDSRQPILYLRSFASDAQKTELGSSYVGRLEELICNSLKQFGPVIAIGQPGEKMPSLGAAKFYATDENWQSAVSRSMTEAQLVVLVAGETQGLKWEFASAFSIAEHSKLIICLPFRTRTRFLRKHSRNREYQEFLNEISEVIPVDLPSAIGNSCLVCFSTTGKPRLVQPGESAFLSESEFPASMAIDALARAFLRAQPQSILGVSRVCGFVAIVDPGSDCDLRDLRFFRCAIWLGSVRSIEMSLPQISRRAFCC